MPDDSSTALATHVKAPHSHNTRQSTSGKRLPLPTILSRSEKTKASPITPTPPGSKPKHLAPSSATQSSPLSEKLPYNLHNIHPDDSRDKVFVAILKALMFMENRPSSPKELANCIMKCGFTVLGGATPYATVSSRISQHFKRAAEHKPPRKPILGRLVDSKHTRKIHYYLATEDSPPPAPRAPESTQSSRASASFAEASSFLDASLATLKRRHPKTRPPATKRPRTNRSSRYMDTGSTSLSGRDSSADDRSPSLSPVQSSTAFQLHRLSRSRSLYCTSDSQRPRPGRGKWAPPRTNPPSPTATTPSTSSQSHTALAPDSGCPNSPAPAPTTTSSLMSMAVDKPPTQRQPHSPQEPCSQAMGTGPVDPSKDSLPLPLSPAPSPPELASQPSRRLSTGGAPSSVITDPTRRRPELLRHHTIAVSHSMTDSTVDFHEEMMSGHLAEDISPLILPIKPPASRASRASSPTQLPSLNEQIEPLLLQVQARQRAQDPSVSPPTSQRSPSGASSQSTDVPNPTPRTKALEAAQSASGHATPRCILPTQPIALASDTQGDEDPVTTSPSNGLARQLPLGEHADEPRTPPVTYFQPYSSTPTHPLTLAPPSSCHTGSPYSYGGSWHLSPLPTDSVFTACSPYRKNSLADLYPDLPMDLESDEKGSSTMSSPLALAFTRETVGSLHTQPRSVVTAAYGSSAQARHGSPGRAPLSSDSELQFAMDVDADATVGTKLASGSCTVPVVVATGLTEINDPESMSLSEIEQLLSSPLARSLSRDALSHGPSTSPGSTLFRERGARYPTQRDDAGLALGSRQLICRCSPSSTVERSHGLRAPMPSDGAYSRDGNATSDLRARHRSLSMNTSHQLPLYRPGLLFQPTPGLTTTSHRRDARLDPVLEDPIAADAMDPHRSSRITRNPTRGLPARVCQGSTAYMSYVCSTSLPGSLSALSLSSSADQPTKPACHSDESADQAAHRDAIDYRHSLRLARSLSYEEQRSWRLGRSRSSRSATPGAMAEPPSCQQCGLVQPRASMVPRSRAVSDLQRPHSPDGPPSPPDSGSPVLPPPPTVPLLSALAFREHVYANIVVRELVITAQGGKLLQFVRNTAESLAASAKAATDQQLHKATATGSVIQTRSRATRHTATPETGVRPAVVASGLHRRPPTSQLPLHQDTHAGYINASHLRRAAKASLGEGKLELSDIHSKSAVSVRTGPVECRGVWVPLAVALILLREFDLADQPVVQGFIQAVSKHPASPSPVSPSNPPVDTEMPAQPSTDVPDAGAGAQDLVAEVEQMALDPAPKGTTAAPTPESTLAAVASPVAIPVGSTSSSLSTPSLMATLAAPGSRAANLITPSALTTRSLLTAISALAKAKGSSCGPLGALATDLSSVLTTSTPTNGSNGPMSTLEDDPTTSPTFASTFSSLLASTLNARSSSFLSPGLRSSSGQAAGDTKSSGDLDKGVSPFTALLNRTIEALQKHRQQQAERREQQSAAASEAAPSPPPPPPRASSPELDPPHAASASPISHASQPLAKVSPEPMVSSPALQPEPELKPKVTTPQPTPTPLVASPTLSHSADPAKKTRPVSASYAAALVARREAEDDAPPPRPDCIPTRISVTPKIYLTIIEATPFYIVVVGPSQGFKRSHTLLRRADTGYVNAERLLSAGGVETDQEKSIVLSLEMDRYRYPSHDSELYGSWIPLPRARALAATCSLHHKLGPFLNDNLQTYFPPQLPPAYAKVSRTRPLPTTLASALRPAFYRSHSYQSLLMTAGSPHPFEGLSSSALNALWATGTPAKGGPMLGSDPRQLTSDDFLGTNATGTLLSTPPNFAGSCDTAPLAPPATKSRKHSEPSGRGQSFDGKALTDAHESTVNLKATDPNARFLAPEFPLYYAAAASMANFQRESVRIVTPQALQKTVVGHVTSGCRPAAATGVDDPNNDDPSSAPGSLLSVGGSPRARAGSKKLKRAKNSTDPPTLSPRSAKRTKAFMSTPVSPHIAATRAPLPIFSSLFSPLPSHSAELPPVTSAQATPSPPREASPTRRQGPRSRRARPKSVAASDASDHSRTLGVAGPRAGRRAQTPTASRNRQATPRRRSPVAAGAPAGQWANPASSPAVSGGDVIRRNTNNTDEAADVDVEGSDGGDGA
ncbi:hypothetical protein H4R34_000270 [Dimargaris verticillata]|uniref:HTH APSES-type domain-containing protein n=1 Tax=Dimargaris verticillata TaxID=2761393 RepID=A0A9W8B6Y7_9FUNG|nr:hypothetical protein H4R34_000270 [Dimargaris verticillata]